MKDEVSAFSLHHINSSVDKKISRKTEDGPQSYSATVTRHNTDRTNVQLSHQNTTEVRLIQI